MKKDKGCDIEAAERLAIAALQFLAEDADRLGRFMAECGLAPEDVRTMAGERSFQAGVLQHLLQDESLLLVFTSQSGIAPEDVDRLQAVLSGRADEYRSI